MLPFQIAYRFLRSSLGQTILIVLGISVGVSVQVFIGSLIGGLQVSLVDATIGNSSQVTIEAIDDGYIRNYEDIKMDIEVVDGIEVVSYSLNVPGTIIVSDKTEPVLLRGFDFELAEDIYQLQDKVTSGRLPLNNNEVILGDALLAELGISLNDTVDIQVPLVGMTTVTVVGTFDFKVNSLNSLWAFGTLETVQTVGGLGDVISTIETQVDDVFSADVIGVEIDELLSDDFLVTNWIDQNAELLSGLTAQSSSSLLIQVFVTISVVLGIAFVLAITVIQKSRQIGILKAMGIKDKTASLIFLSQGFILGVFGAIGGVLLGLGLTWSFTTFAVDDFGEPVIDLLIDPQFILISGLVAIVSASLASVIPARKSSKLSVIEVIKNG